MNKNTVNKMIIIAIALLYPFINLYSRKIQMLTGLSLSLIIVLLFLVPILLNLSELKHFILEKKPLYYFSVLLLAISLLWSTEFTRGFFYILVLIIAPLFGLSIYKSNYTYKVWKTFSYSTLIFSMLLYSRILLKGYNYYDYGGTRFGYILGNEVSLDPNWLGAWLAVSFIYFFIQSKREPNALKTKLNKFKKSKYLILAFICLYFLFKTGSLSASIALVIALTAYALVNKKYIASIFAGMVAILLALIVIGTSSNNILIFDRLSGLDIKNNERIELLVSTREAITDNTFNFIFGYGAGSGDKAIGKYYRGAQVQEDGIVRYNNHNTYLDFVLQLGSIGLFIVAFIILWSIKVLYKSFKINNNAFSLLLIFVLTQSIFYNPIKNGFFIIGYGIATALYLNNQE
jgi:O-antigen ligase